MRSLITTLQTNNKLLKSDNLRTKKRLQELTEEFEKYKKENNNAAKIQQPIKSEPATSAEVTSNGPHEESHENNKHNFEFDTKVIIINPDDSDLIKDLKEKLRQSYDSQKLLISKNNYKSELDEARQEIKRLKETVDKLPSGVAGVDYAKKIKSLEDNVRDLHKNLSNKKQEEIALLNDMEITGQAYEDMQEQNIRLMQQLREKDDANFKLMSERIKLETTQKTLKEEKDSLIEQVIIKKIKINF